MEPTKDCCASGKNDQVLAGEGQHFSGENTLFLAPGGKKNSVQHKGRNKIERQTCTLRREQDNKRLPKPLPERFSRKSCA